MRTASSTAAIAAAFAFAAGCSLINSFDDLKTEAPATGGKTSTGGNESTGGSESTGGADASADGGETTDGGGGTGGTATGGATGTGGGGVIKDSGADAPFVPGGDGGAIVGFSNKQLVVLNPIDGTLLSAENMGTVRGITNDVATDVWYIFEQTGLATEPLTLHVRELRTSDGKWNEIGKLAAVPVPASSRPQALNGRLVYLSTPTPLTSDPATLQLTVLNTQDPTKVTVVLPAGRALPKGVKQGLIGAPSNTVGGIVNVVALSDTCEAGDAGRNFCDVNLIRYNIGTGTTVQEGATEAIGKTLASGNTSFALDPRGPAAIVALPVLVDPGVGAACTAVTPDNGSILRIAMSDFAQVGAAVPFATKAHRFGGSAAYDPCLDTAFVTTAIADKAIWSVPLGGGTPEKKCVTTAGASLLVEPYTRTLIRGVAGGGVPEFYDITGSASAPKLESRSLTKLPKNFAPLTLSVREVDRARVACPK
jgi:hypothetical protein